MLETPPSTRGLTPPARLYNAFTLVELLVAITILIILTTLVLAAFQRDDGDRLNASARTIQSYLEGARSRAITTGRTTGVRLIANANDPYVVDSLVYIGSNGYDTGTCSIAYSGSFWYVTNGTSGEWGRLVQPTIALAGGSTWTLNASGRDLLRYGSRIQIPRGTGAWYTVRFAEDVNLNGTLDAGEDLDGDMVLDYFPNILVLNEQYNPSEWNGSTYVAQPATGVEYRLELAPTVLPNVDPTPLQRGIVIDQHASRISSYDILFDPRGNPTGDAATEGLVHLYVTALSDVELTRNLLGGAHPADGGTFPQPIVPYVPSPVTGTSPKVPKFEPYIITLFTQTGQVTTSRVFYSDVLNNVDGSAGSDGIADDPYAFARRGREAQ